VVPGEPTCARQLPASCQNSEQLELGGPSMLQQLQMRLQTFNHRHEIAEFFIASYNEPL
jgi:hypothetical protein